MLKTRLLPYYIASLCIFVFCKESVFAKKNVSQLMHESIIASSFFVHFSENPSDSLSAHSKQDALGDRKTSNKALVIAVVPGFVVHGAGHLYLGKTSTGLALLVTEVVGLGLFYVGAASTVGDGGSSVGVVLIPAGVVLFLGSWVVDIVGSANATQ